MSICLPNFTISSFTICEIITFKVQKNVFFALQNGNSSLMGSKKTTFSSRYGMCLSIFLFLSELGKCSQNLIPTRSVEPWIKHQFLQGGIYANIHIPRLFFDNKNSIWKILRLKIWMVETCFNASSTCRNSYFWKTLQSQFLVVFQNFVDGEILAVLGNFGYKLLH